VLVFGLASQIASFLYKFLETKEQPSIVIRQIQLFSLRIIKVAIRPKQIYPPAQKTRCETLIIQELFYRQKTSWTTGLYFLGKRIYFLPNRLLKF